MRKNPYDVLGVGRYADLKDIKSAYRRAAKNSHPDRNIPGRRADRFCEIQEAYETLKDAQLRKQCDRELAKTEAGIRNAGRFGRVSPAMGSSGIPVRPVEPPIPTFRYDSRDLRLEIVLSPLEARTGGRFPIRIPVETVCPGCGDTVPFVGFCTVCRGSGRLRRDLAVMLDLPAGIRDGSRATATIGVDGVGGSVLTLYFRIDPRAG